GAIGLLIICLVMCVRYKGLGLLSSIALLIYSILLVLLLALVPWVQLTLPGIAGIILSIGMAVDANVIIFERIREEYATGKTVAAAIKTGFGRAFWTIFDSNITTIIAAIILLILCPGTIKGFSITLLIGILLSMFTALVVTRWLINLFNPLVKEDKKPAFYNLKKGGQVDEI
ncbi:MAG: MMPL family transporter, partial [Clostridia bacterium]|nr:MMPL family transporter [Clostridia bacterium]